MGDLVEKVHGVGVSQTIMTIQVPMAVWNLVTQLMGILGSAEAILEEVVVGEELQFTVLLTTTTTQTQVVGSSTDFSVLSVASGVIISHSPVQNVTCKLLCTPPTLEVQEPFITIVDPSQTP